MRKPQIVLSFVLALAALAALGSEPSPVAAQRQGDKERDVSQQIGALRAMPDDVRASTTKKLALEIRSLSAGDEKVGLADDLAHHATEGDLGGRDTLQAATTTLADALREHPMLEERGRPAEPYFELAELVRYEHTQASLESPEFSEAMQKLEAYDRQRQQADFTLSDINGQKWTLSKLHGKVVALNFWATWCPPCRKEMPDLQLLYNKFSGQGFVVLAISDEDLGKVRPFITEHGFTFPVLLDPGERVYKLFRVVDRPETFVYNRQGRLAAESIDMRTRRQFLNMLREAGLH